jgi:hypothetical protein
MPTNDFVSDWQEAPIRTVGAFDPRLFTDVADPFIGAGGCVTGFARPAALETAGVNVLPAPEERTKQDDLFSRRGGIRNGSAFYFHSEVLAWTISRTIIEFRFHTYEVKKCFFMSGGSKPTLQGPGKDTESTTEKRSGEGKFDSGKLDIR